MKQSFVVMALTALLCSLALSGVPTPKAEDEIIKLERDWLAAEASGDMSTLRHLISDDFIGTAFGPNVLTKMDIVPPDGPGENRIGKSSLRDATVKIFGDTAVLMGTVVMDDPKQPGGLRVTTVYQKHPQGWQMIAAHMSPAPTEQ